MDEVLIVKLLLLLIMGILPLLFGLLPLKILDFLSKTDGKRSLQLSSLSISILSCFAGGVVLSVSLIELFPEAREGLALLQQEDSFYQSYPFVELLVGAGFLLVYFVEEAISEFGVSHHHHNQKKSSVSSKTFPSASSSDIPANDTRDLNRNRGSTSRVDQNSTNYNSMERTAGRGNAETGAIIQPSSLNATKDVDVENRRAVVSAATLVLAMSFHTSLEGFAFGIQDQLVAIYSLFFGILIHKILVFFSIGISLTQSLFPRRTLIFTLVALLSTFSPLGGVVGILVESSELESHSKVLVTTALTSLSIGTFLYIALFEIISAERNKHHSKLFQWAGCAFGFFLMAVALSFFSHCHTQPGHGHHSHNGN